MGLSNEKLLSEENEFTSDNIIQGFNNLFEKINDKINSNHTSNIKEAKLKDQETREEQLGDLDIRLKSLSPRKGKIEVEDYDRRLNELEKHEKKLEKHKENINAKNKVADEENNKILEKCLASLVPAPTISATWILTTTKHSATRRRTSTGVPLTSM